MVGVVSEKLRTRMNGVAERQPVDRLLMVIGSRALTCFCMACIFSSSHCVISRIGFIAQAQQAAFGAQHFRAHVKVGRGGQGRVVDALAGQVIAVQGQLVAAAAGACTYSVPSGAKKAGWKISLPPP